MPKFNYITLLLFTGLLGGCKIQAPSVKDGKFRLPAVYTTAADTSAATLPTPGAFFRDAKLIALIDTALKNNFDLRLAAQRIEMARAGLRLQQGNNLPDLWASMVVGQRKFGKYTIDGVGNYDTGFSTNLDDNQKIPDPVIPDYYLGVQSSWEADLWGKLKSRRKAAAARFIASSYGKELITTSLVADVSDMYFELIILDNEKTILDENIVLQQSALDIVSVLKQAGEANQLGVELIHAQLLNSRALRVEVDQKIIEVENRVNFLLGRFPQPVERSALVWEDMIPPAIRAGVPTTLLANRPDIREAEFELLAADADVYAAKAAFYPSFNISAGMGLQAFRAAVFLNPASFAYTLAGGLAAPLLNRRQIAADLMASESGQKQAYIAYQKTVVNSFTEVYNFLNLIGNTDATYDLKSREVEILRSSVETSRQLFRSGRATYLEVITAQKTALQAQIELVTLRKQQYHAVIGLYKSLGGGWSPASVN